MDALNNEKITANTLDEYSLLTQHVGCIGAELKAVFVHGMLEDEHIWNGVLPLLDNIESTLFKFPWSGEQDGYWGSKGHGAKWLERGLKTIDFKPNVIIAHSYGCLVTLNHLLSHPNEQPEYLILISPFYRKYKNSIGWDTLNSLISGLRDLISESVTNADIHNRYSGEIKQLMISRLMDKLNVFGWVEFLNDFLKTPDMELKNIKSKTLIITGDSDAYSPIEDAQSLSNEITGSHYCVIKNAGHFPMQTHTNEVAIEINKQLKITEQ